MDVTKPYKSIGFGSWVVPRLAPDSWRCLSMPPDRPTGRSRGTAQHSLGAIPTKPYNFLGFGAIQGPKPYKFIGFGNIRGPKPYKFIGFGDIHGPKPYKFIGFGAPLPSHTGTHPGYHPGPPVCRGLPPCGVCRLLCRNVWLLSCLIVRRSENSAFLSECPPLRKLY